MSNLTICRGIPASGKTTWAKEWAAEAPNRARVCRDDLRGILFNRYSGLSHDQEKRVTKIQHDGIKDLLEEGFDVAVDDTNLRAKTVRGLVDVAKAAGATVSYRDFPISLVEAKNRDLARELRGERSVGNDVIESFWSRYTRKGVLPPFPLEGERTGRLGPTYVPDTSLPKAWLVDIDGTLAHMQDRGPFEWHRVGEDLLDEHIASLVDALKHAYYIVVVSGRDAICRPETVEWLRGNGVAYDALIMRDQGDSRKDSIVKEELLWRDIAPRWWVQGVLDDRDRVVEMWRNLGLTCLQVAPGNF